MVAKGGFIHILSNKNKSTLYLGVTSDLIGRMYEHKEKIDSKSFSARFNLNKLVYFESFSFIEEAIAREKQLKSGSRKKKVELIESMNPEWIDLYTEILRTC